ncbi:MAG TPA: PH domain-containing protein [Vicinamibacterales bacterium]
MDTAATAPPSPPQPAVADGLEHRLDPRIVRVHRMGGWITTAVTAGPFGVVLIGALLNPDPPVWLKALLTALWAGLSLLLGWWLHRYPALAYDHASYRIDEDVIEIRRGVVFRRVISVPRTRVQHTDVSQGPIERAYGLGTLVIYTAGTEYARVSLSGLEHGRALAIRDHLLPRGGADAV